MKRKRISALGLCALLCLSLAACGSGGQGESGDETGAVSSLPIIDNTKWQYSADDDVYYQTGISYCETPADESYETLAVFVPGAYFSATDNGDGTYTCEMNEEADVNGYTARTAPIVFPVNTPGYSAQEALTGYTSVSEYTDAGFVYVHAGCRGRDAGAPAGVTDLKAAVRYIRYSDESIPGDAESIFSFGMSGGGAQSSVLGATGDSDLYTPYLEQIGAVQGVSDAVLGSMCWCPITNLDTADEAYEWMLGSTRSGLSDEEQEISDKLAEAFADYINEAGFKDENGNALTLEESDEGIYQAGTYYDYMKSVIEDSLNDFLQDTEFPYDASSSTKSGFGGPGGGDFGGGIPGGKGNGQKPDRQLDSDQMPAGNGSDKDANFGGTTGNDADENGGSGGREVTGEGEEPNFEDIDDIQRNGNASSSGLDLSGTYETAQDYIDALNENGEWVSYDAETNTASITSITDFVNNLKTASKSLGAFDQLDRGQGENTLFGYGDGNGAHFDGYLEEVLNDIGSSYTADYTSDLSKEDSAGNTAEVRVDMYTPLYYLLDSSEGYKTSVPAKYWRIRTGINQGDCALSTEMDLALALENCDSVGSVDFETVWGQGHTQAERTGSSTDNFIAWVNKCMNG